MNVIRLMGGLGNQIFQYAFGKAQMQNGIDVRFTLSWYDKSKNIHRPFRLDKFKINVPIYLSTGRFVYERNTGFDISLLRRDNIDPVGYWQYYPYFKDIIPILQKEIKVREECYTEQFLALREAIVNSDSISIHVRRGDYLNQKGFHDLPLRYYFEAIGMLSRRDSIFIFSDDIPWCREKFKQDYFQEKITFIDMEDYLSFELMRLCKKNIATNSTFSYWAALLNDNPCKVVVSPNRWLGDPEPDIKEQRFPKEWIKIPDYVA